MGTQQAYHLRDRKVYTDTGGDFFGEFSLQSHFFYEQHNFYKKNSNEPAATQVVPKTVDYDVNRYTVCIFVINHHMAARRNYPSR